MGMWDNMPREWSVFQTTRFGFGEFRITTASAASLGSGSISGRVPLHLPRRAPPTCRSLAAIRSSSSALVNAASCAANPLHQQ